MKQTRTGPSEGRPERLDGTVLIVEARFYEGMLDELGRGARSVLDAHGLTHETVTVNGALEIPGAIALAEASGRYDGYVALGVVIRGETGHYDIVAGESSRGLMELTLDGLCIGNGILTVETEAQAWARAKVSEMDKGGGAAAACIALLRLARRFADDLP
jgi:6,7-dimethyl-8-ribityllumazine synthase